MVEFELPLLLLQFLFALVEEAFLGLLEFFALQSFPQFIEPSLLEEVEEEFPFFV